MTKLTYRNVERIITWFTLIPNRTKCDYKLVDKLRKVMQQISRDLRKNKK